MTKKERVEDLGRLLELINASLEDNEIFRTMNRWRPKDFSTAFYSLTQVEQMNLLSDIAYGIQGIKESLYEFLTIASGDEEDYP